MDNVPFSEDGVVNVSQTTAAESLESLPEGRRCGKCGRTVFVHGDSCPGTPEKGCGGLLLNNTRSLRHGKHSRKALEKRRLELLAKLRETYPYGDAGELELMARSWALSERASNWVEASPLSITSPKQQRAVKTALEAHDRYLRAAHLLASKAPANGGAAVTPFTLVVDELTDADIAEIKAKRDGGDTRLQHPELPAALERAADYKAQHPNNHNYIAMSGGMRDLAIEKVSTRAQMLAALGETDDDAIDGEVLPSLPEPRLVRETGTISQVGAALGGLLTAEREVLWFVVGDQAANLPVGALVTYMRQGNKAVDIRAVEGEER